MHNRSILSVNLFQESRLSPWKETPSFFLPRGERGARQEVPVFRSGLLAIAVWLLALVAAFAATESEPDTSADEAVLRAANVAVDGPALLAFFRGRTLTAEGRRQVEEWASQLGSEDFRTRERASRELTRHGPAARPYLKKALADSDVEVARRAARCLEEIDSGPGAALPAAAARLLARRAPPGAVPTLLDYLPFADDEEVEEEILAALLALTPPGAGDAALSRALRDAQPAVRAGAAHVLARKGDEAHRAAVRPLLRDPDPRVRFRAAHGLLAARDRSAVPVLVDLLVDAPLELASRTEEVLLHLAGEKGPSASVHGGADARRQCRDAWRAWWASNEASVDLARGANLEQLAGLTLGIEYNTGRVWERAPDGTVRWEITHLRGPMEAQVLRGGRVLIAESNACTVSERDFRGNVLWQTKLDVQPTGCQRLPNGNTFISTYQSVRELTPDGKVAYDFKLPAGSNAIRKHRNGHIVYAAEEGIVELDTTGRQVRTVPLPRQSMYVGLHEVPGDHFLVANSSTGQVLEVDAAGKVLWKANVPGACGVWRLPNGHTLVATNGRVVELNKAGTEVWHTAATGYVRRVHRR
jgi:hypothetical protein